MAQLYIIPAAQRDAWIRARGAVYQGQNQKGGYVYKAKGVTYVVSPAGPGRLQVREIKAGCNC